MKCLFPAVIALTAFTLASTSQAFAQAPATAAETALVPWQTVARIAPENTRIEFVGTHVGDDPKPRLGGFSKFDGMIGVDLGKKQVTSIHVEMQIGSIWTEFDNLTQHLMNADFFDTEKFPSAAFKSTKITTLQNGTCNVEGELTLHGTTSTVRFPANYSVEEKGLALSAQFFLDRTEFGMTKMTDGVEPTVSINVVVGSPTKNADSKTGNGSDTKSKAADEAVMAKGETVTIKLPHMT